MLLTISQRSWENKFHPYVIRYLSHKFNWKRIVDDSLPIVQGIIKGSMPASYYKHIIVSGYDYGNKKNYKLPRVYKNSVTNNYIGESLK